MYHTLKGTLYLANTRKRKKLIYQQRHLASIFKIILSFIRSVKKIIVPFILWQTII